MVAVPTMKLRLACSSCSATAVFCERMVRQVDARQQHVEVALRHPRHQVLRRRRELRLGLLDLHFGLLVASHCSAAGTAAG